MSAITIENYNQVTVSLRDGHVVLSDGIREVVSDGMFADGIYHRIQFKRLQDGEMTLNVDGTETRLPPFTTSDITITRGEESRKKRQLNPAAFNARVYVYLGGSENLAMFNGCMKYPYIKGDVWHPHFLTEGMRCGAGKVVCVGRPLFNACGYSDRQKPESVNVEAASPVQRKRRKRKRNRKKPGNRPNDLVASIESINELNAGYDAHCNLPYEPQTSGQRYIGNGYSKYYVKRFNSYNWRYSLSIRTKENQGLIFFMSDSRCNEHIAVYLAKGKIIFSTMFGEEHSRLKSLSRCDKGVWHKITFERKGNSTQLMLNNSIESQGNMFSESLSFPSNMPAYVGGLHAIPKNFAADHIQPKNLIDFNGCIKDVLVNGAHIDGLSSRIGLHINVSSCFEGGTEPGMFFPRQQEQDSSAYMTALNSYNVAANMEVMLEIKPRIQSGLLFAISGSTGNFFNLALIEGRVAARLRQDGETLFSSYDPEIFGSNLCDGAWHTVRVIKAKNIIVLTVDDNLVTPIEGSLQNKNCWTDGALFIGGLPSGAHVEGLLTDSQYVGCIRKMRVDLFPVNPNTAITVNRVSSACPLF